MLGGLLLDNLAWDRAADLLTDSDFYRYEHRLILRRGRRPGQRQQAGRRDHGVRAVAEPGPGRQACGGLAVPERAGAERASAANIRRYAEIVRERAILRKLIAASDEIATTAFNPTGRRSYRSSTSRGRSSRSAKRLAPAQGFQGIDKLVVALLDRVNELHENGAEG